MTLIAAYILASLIAAPFVGRFLGGVGGHHAELDTSGGNEEHAS